MFNFILGALTFALGALMGAWIVDRVKTDKPVIPHKQVKHKAKAAVRDEDLE